MKIAIAICNSSYRWGLIAGIFFANWLIVPLLFHDRTFMDGFIVGLIAILVAFVLLKITTLISFVLLKIFDRK